MLCDNSNDLMRFLAHENGAVFANSPIGVSFAPPYDQQLPNVHAAQYQMVPVVAQSPLRIVPGYPSAVSQPSTSPSPAMNPANAPQPIINEIQFTKQIPTPLNKISELNRRLQDRHGMAWWDPFVWEFFDDSATLTLSLNDGMQNFTLSRAVIPGFFKSFFDDGAVELSFNPRYSEQSSYDNLILLCSGKCAMEIDYVHPVYSKVITEGCLILEFVADERMRIRSWQYIARSSEEYIPRAALAIQTQQANPGFTQEWCMNIALQGIPMATLMYLDTYSQ